MKKKIVILLMLTAVLLTSLAITQAFGRMSIGRDGIRELDTSGIEFTEDYTYYDFLLDNLPEEDRIKHNEYYLMNSLKGIISEENDKKSTMKI